MAANTKYVYIGTSSSVEAVTITKSNLRVTALGEYPTDVTSITSDPYGYITVAAGSEFTVYNPTGSSVEGGGGAEFMLGTIQAVPAASILLGDVTTVQNVHVTQKVGSQYQEQH